ncbi:MAG: phosphoglycerate kinase [Roseibacillus sp.]|nr:phosphoglycerate kinase [Roseibacillus sp.]
MMVVDEIGEWRGKRVLLRADFNVPLDTERQITEDFRIQAVLPTIRLLSESGGRVILMSHLGRPSGFDPALSLKPVAEALSKMLSKPVLLAPNCVGPEVTTMVEQMRDGEILLLENLRFHPQENGNDPDFARELATLGEVYVSDAFACAHRSQASNVGIVEFMKPCLAGLLMRDEIEKFVNAIKEPERPLVSIVGGEKLSAMVDTVKNLLLTSDKLCIGGQMSYTFRKAKGGNTGGTFVEEDQIEVARELLVDGDDKIALPADCIVEHTSDLAPGPKKYRTGFFDQATIDTKYAIDPALLGNQTLPDGLQAPGMEPNEKGIDIGALSMMRFGELGRSAKTLVWTGRMGDHATVQSSAGSRSIAALLVLATLSGVSSITGTHEMVKFLKQEDLNDHIFHLSTGDRSFIRVLEGKELPGIIALST